MTMIEGTTLFTFLQVKYKINKSKHRDKSCTVFSNNRSMPSAYIMESSISRFFIKSKIILPKTPDKINDI